MYDKSKNLILFKGDKSLNLIIKNKIICDVVNINTLLLV